MELLWSNLKILTPNKRRKIKAIPNAIMLLFIIQTQAESQSGFMWMQYGHTISKNLLVNDINIENREKMQSKTASLQWWVNYNYGIFHGKLWAEFIIHTSTEFTYIWEENNTINGGLKWWWIFAQIELWKEYCEQCFEDLLNIPRVIWHVWTRHIINANQTIECDYNPHITKKEKYNITQLEWGYGVSLQLKKISFELTKIFTSDWARSSINTMKIEWDWRRAGIKYIF
jgi:hypothetical protein